MAVSKYHLGKMLLRTHWADFILEGQDVTIDSQCSPSYTKCGELLCDLESICDELRSAGRWKKSHGGYVKWGRDLEEEAMNGETDEADL